jgi:hypothetical protein
MSGAIGVDISDFVTGVESVGDAVLRAAERGASKAGMRLLNDATMQIPATPIDEGTLRGSGSVIVNNRLHGTAPKTGGDPTPATEDSEPTQDDAIVAVVGFNTAYAAHLHEHPEFEFTDSRAGGKYLEKPLHENAEDYEAIVAAEIARELD